ncbi:hypothetical protein ACF0H5_022775 [Mactra antiquata]
MCVATFTSVSQGIYSNCVFSARSCNTGEIVGQETVSLTSAVIGSDTGKTYLLDGTNIKISCCGVVTKWTFGLMNTGDVTAQVWKPLGGDMYEVVGETSGTGTANSLLQMTPSQIAVNENYAIGWYSSSQEVVGYINDAGANLGTKSKAGRTNLNQQLSWAATATNTERWLVQVQLGPGTAPTFGASLPHTANVASTDPVGTKVHTVTPTDVNTGDTLTVTFNPPSTKFQLVGNEVRLLTTLTPGTHTAVIQVADSCGLTATGTLTVTVADSAPNITSLPVGTVTLKEDVTVRTELHILTYTDTDTPLKDVKCSFNSTDPSPAPFAIEMKANSSVQAVNFVPNATKLDFDTTPLYKLFIQCSDGTSTSTIKELHVSIEANAPPVPNIPSPLTVPASTTVTNTNVGAVTATDADSTNLQFTMSNCSCPLVMTPDGKVYATASFNDHRTPFYKVNVTVSDGYNTVGPTEMTIQVTELNTRPVVIMPATALPGRDEVSVDEHTDEGTPNAKGTTVTVFTPKGQDAEGDTLTWEANFNNGKGILLYELNPTTGVITTKQDLDYETLTPDAIAETIVQIRAYDGREYSDWKELKIKVNDINETPKFANSLYSIETKESAGTLQCPYFDVIDEDFHDTQTYSLDCGTVGTIKVKANSNQCGSILEQLAEIDLDSPGAATKTISCTVTVRDKHGLTNTTTLVITVHEEDDNSPDFNPEDYTFTIFETQAPAVVFGSTGVTDLDFLAKHKRITYTNSPEGEFGVNAAGGIYSKINWTSQTLPTSRTFTVTATDAAGHSDQADVTVYIKPVPTTTSTTTTTTTLAPVFQNIASFLDDPGNLGWLIPAILVGLAALGLSIFMCIRCCNTPGALANMCKGGNICPRRGRGRITRRVPRAKEPVVKRTLVREKPEPPKQVVEKEVPKQPKEPKKDSSMFDCFKSKPKQKPAAPTESWDFWNSGGF